MTRGRVRSRRPARVVLGTGALLLATATLTSCGDREAPGQKDPGLETALAQVETALAAGTPQRARTQLQSIVERARAGEADGTLSSAEADAIIAAARTLLDRIPEPVAKPTPTVEPPPKKDRRDGGGKKHHKKGDDDED